MKANDAISTGWPVLTRCEGAALRRVSLPLGGIGTGTVSLGGRGDLRDFEVMNRPAKGHTPNHAFFALWCKPVGDDGEDDGAEAVTRCLEGPIDDALFDGPFGSNARNHNLPRFRECRFDAAYPLGQVHLSDPDVPLGVRLDAFNPFIPTDADRSGIPVAVLRWTLTNLTDRLSTAAVCLSVPNFVGDDGVAKRAKGNKNAYRFTQKVGGLLLSPGREIPKDADTWGTLFCGALSVVPYAHRLSYRTAWANVNWGDSLLDFWDDFSDDGILEERESGGVDQPVASYAIRVALKPGESVPITFLLAWHFPNRRGWNGDGPVIGNYYATLYKDAWDVAKKTAANLPALEADSVRFVRAFVESDLPAVVKEAALYNASTLRTQTCFRTEGGKLFGWEGCSNTSGCCHGTCTHVWNYEITTPYLFGALSRSLREVEFGFSTTERGKMSFRTGLPLSGKATEWVLAAADGQMGCLMKFYRDWKLCGDDDFLRRFWPRVKKALEFCWIPGGWDADRDGVMEGCQHNTMDVEYYGPNPQMGTWYLGALRACEEMARHLGETDFADECRRLFENGSRYLDETLFNGQYYEHHIVPPDTGMVSPELRHESMGARDLSEPELQLGAGCLIDQLVGQYMAEVCGLGYLLRPENIRATLASLMRYNFKESLWGHFNHSRTYALQDEAAMLMATYPLGRRPKRPFPYCNEVMTGFEYTAAAHLLYERMTDDGLKVIAAVRARHNGTRRNPFDEPECGRHYARAMAAWASVLALTGFHYDGTTGQMTFARPDRPVTWFWSTGDAWGTVALTPEGNVRLTIEGGKVLLRTLKVGEATTPIPDARIYTAGETVTATATAGV